MNLQRQEQIKQGLMQQQRAIKSLVGDKEKANKFLATASKIANDYKLNKCNPQSIVDACVTVAQMGLDLNPVLNHCYLVPFKQSVQLIVSAKGYSALLARTGWKIKSFIVRENDKFEYSINGFNEHILFEPTLDDDTPISFAYAVAKSPDGDYFYQVMSVKEIEKHRMKSSNQNSNKATGVWADWYAEMAQKTVIKKLIKKLPLGEEIATAVSVDDMPIEVKEEDQQQVEEFDLNAMLVNQETGEVTEKLVDQRIKNTDLLADIDYETTKDDADA